MSISSSRTFFDLKKVSWPLLSVLPQILTQLRNSIFQIILHIFDILLGRFQKDFTRAASDWSSAQKRRSHWLKPMSFGNLLTVTFFNFNFTDLCVRQQISFQKIHFTNVILMETWPPVQNLTMVSWWEWVKIGELLSKPGIHWLHGAYTSGLFRGLKFWSLNWAVLVCRSLIKQWLAKKIITLR